MADLDRDRDPAVVDSFLLSMVAFVLQKIQELVHPHILIVHGQDSIDWK